MTLRLARALCDGRPPVEVAMLDLELQRAAGESLRRWRKRPMRLRRQRAYDEAASRLAGHRSDTAGLLQAGMLMAVLDLAVERARGEQPPWVWMPPSDGRGS